jgi:adenylate cyclase
VNTAPFDAGNSIAASARFPAICNRFREAWRKGNAAPRLDDFRYDPSVADNSAQQRELLLDLVAVDLEERWRRGGGYTGSADTSIDEKTVRARTDGFPMCPLLEDYIARYPEAGPLTRLPVRLVAVEYSARHLWGDHPARDEYFRRFPHLARSLDQVLGHVPTAAQLTLRLYYQGKPVLTTSLTNPVELGRQRKDEPPPFQRVSDPEGDRIIIATQRENTISRRHVRLAPDRDGKVLVTNLSSNRPIDLDSGARLLPGATCELPLGTLLVIGDRAARVQQPAIENLHLKSLAQPTVPPGMSLQRSAQLASLVSMGPGQTEEELGQWLQAVMGVVQGAAGSADFLGEAAQAVVEIADLDSGAVVLWEEGQWRIKARAGKAAATPDTWAPSQTMLHRVQLERRTLRHAPRITITDEGPSSLVEVNALVAAPILNSEGEVVGVLYGDRRTKAGDLEISSLEALLVELIASGVAAGLARIEQERVALAARVQFEQFFTTELARQLEEDPKILDGKEAEVTVLFSDIRGFSRISEKLGPAGTVAWVRDVMGALSDCVIAHQGVVVDYIGDELMAMWGAPVERPDHAALACRAAIDMLAVLPSLNRRWRDELGEDMGLGIGINSGIARVGNTGTHRKFKYTPLGSAVNLANRVQGVTKQVKTPLLITGATAMALDDSFAVRRLCRVRVVNISEAVDLYELSSEVGSNWQLLKVQYEEALTAFERGEFFLATRILGNLLESHPTDGPTLVLLSRAVAFLADDDEQFSPVWQLREK